MSRAKLILWAAALLLFGCGRGVGVGSAKKIGRLVRVAQTGMFCQTAEATIIRGGFTDGDGTNGTAFDFSVPDASQVVMLERLMSAQVEVEITYDLRSMSGPCTSATPYLLRSIRVLEKPGPGAR